MEHAKIELIHIYVNVNRASMVPFVSVVGNEVWPTWKDQGLM